MAQAQEHVRLERELAQLRALVTEVSQAPAELTERVHRGERVPAVLHANRPKPYNKTEFEFFDPSRKNT